MNGREPAASLSRRLPIIAILALLVYAGYQVMQAFLVPLAWAAILAYVSWPMYRQLCRLLRGRRTTGAWLMTLLLVAAVVLPVLAIAGLLAGEVRLAYETITARLAGGALILPESVAGLPVVGEWLRQFLTDVAGDPAVLRAEIGRWAQQFSGVLAGLAGGLGRNLVGLGLTVVIVFFCYRDGEQLVEQVRRLLRQLLGERAEGYILAVGATVTAVMYGMLLTAIAQGALAGIGYWFVGLEAPILLATVTALFALVPFGAPLVWGTIGLWLIIDQQTWAGVILLAWGALLVSSIDNLIRPLVISSATRVHFLLVLFGVLGGAMAFGFVGLIVGPVVLAVAAAVWREWLVDAAANAD
jgi:predicted PurR-regulated permease PerM